MIMNLEQIEHIYLVTNYTDLRKAADGCSAIVQYNLLMNPFSKNIFLFCNRSKTTIQILQWDKNGFWVHKKKLVGKDRFRWPKNKEEAQAMMIDERQLEWLLSGLDLVQKHAHHEINAVINA